MEETLEYEEKISGPHNSDDESHSIEDFSGLQFG